MSLTTLLGDAVRRNPYPLYTALRRVRPVLHDRAHDLWLLFDHPSVQRALVDHETFSSLAAPPGGAPLDWMIFTDPPRHTKLRALVMRTFAPRAIAALEPQIHFCLGAALARLEARVALKELLTRAEDLRVPNPRWVPRRALNVHGPRELGVVLGHSGRRPAPGDE